MKLILKDALLNVVDKVADDGDLCYVGTISLSWRPITVEQVEAFSALRGRFTIVLTDEPVSLRKRKPKAAPEAPKARRGRKPKAAPADTTSDPYLAGITKPLASTDAAVAKALKHAEAAGASHYINPTPYTDEERERLAKEGSGK